LNSRSSMYRRLMGMAGAVALTAGGLGAVLAAGGTAYASTSLTSAPFSVGSATSVSAVSLSLTNSTESAPSVQYTVSFKATTAGSATDSIMIASGTGVGLSGATAVSVVDNTSDAATSSATSSYSSGTLTVTPGFAWSAGDQITVVLSGVTNPSTSPASVTVATSTDANAASSNSVTLSAGYSPVDSANPAIPTDTGVTWTFEGAATAAVAPGGTLNLSDSSATSGDEGSFTTGGVYTVVDNTSGKTFVIPASDVSISNDATTSPYASIAVLTLPSGDSIASSDELTVTVTDAVNGTSTQSFGIDAPAGGTAVTQTVDLGNSVNAFSASAPGAVVDVPSNVTLDFTSNVGGSADIYVTGFTPGSTNLLTNLTTGVQHALTNASGTLTGYTTVAGDKYQLVSYGATFSSSGSVAVGLSTSKDTIPATQNVTVAAASSQPQIQVTLSDSQPGALSNWTVSNIEANGALTGGSSSDTLTLTSTGAVFPSYGPDYSLTDSTTPSDSFTNPPIINGGGTDSVTIELPNGLASGDVFSINVDGVINPSSVDINDDATLASSSSAGVIEAAQAPVTTVPKATMTYPNGALIQSGGQIDVVAGGYAFGIPTPTVLGDIMKMDHSSVQSGTFPTATMPAPGTLINPVGTSGYWVVGTNGEIYQFSSMSQFMQEGYVASQVIPVPNAGGLTAGAGAPPKASTTMANGALVQFGSTIYEYAGGVPTGIQTPAQLASIQKMTGAMVVMGSGSTPTAAKTSANGTLVQPLGKAGIWVSDGGTLYQFMSASQFTNDGYSFQYVLPIATLGTYTPSSI
jgi:hypothetical protein